MTGAKSLSALQHAARALALIPSTARVAVLMRHAERDIIPKGQHGNEAPLTPQGEKDSATMGDLLKERNIELFHSPARRCVQTANSIGGANHPPLASKKSMSLRCDAYVEDFESALPTLSRLISEHGFYDLFVKQLSKEARNPPYPHFRPPLSAAAELMAGLLPHDKGQAGIGVTHDWLVNVAASHATGLIIERKHDAHFLGALFIWKDSGGVCYYHKGRAGKCPKDFQQIFVRALKNDHDQ
ncbi:histidine phosphatase family protein [Candidatus Spongiihabitans sp.]|uniref:histidine phosphatase family protein n=1 Tax=Candidatus Spongiihabitans sp. TaxID=3101308 RepID=UPI003C6EC386